MEEDGQYELAESIKADLTNQLWLSNFTFVST
jgi:hypothetical protein